MTPPWSPAQLAAIGPAQELEIARLRPDGTPGRWTPIWVVSAGGQVYVRTWYRRTTGWFGHVVAQRRARVRVPPIELDVVVDDIGEQLRARIDLAYRDKYGRYGQATVDRMVGDDAAATTLRLSPQ